MDEMWEREPQVLARPGHPDPDQSIFFFHQPGSYTNQVKPGNIEISLDGTEGIDKCHTFLRQAIC